MKGRIVWIAAAITLATTTTVLTKLWYTQAVHHTRGAT